MQKKKNILKNFFYISIGVLIFLLPFFILFFGWGIETNKFIKINYKSKYNIILEHSQTHIWLKSIISFLKENTAYLGITISLSSLYLAVTNFLVGKYEVMDTGVSLKKIIEKIGKNKFIYLKLNKYMVGITGFTILCCFYIKFHFVAWLLFIYLFIIVLLTFVRSDCFFNENKRYDAIIDLMYDEMNSLVNHQKIIWESLIINNIGHSTNKTTSSIILINKVYFSLLNANRFRRNSAERFCLKMSFYLSRGIIMTGIHSEASNVTNIQFLNEIGRKMVSEMENEIIDFGSLKGYDRISVLMGILLAMITQKREEFDNKIVELVLDIYHIDFVAGHICNQSLNIFWEILWIKGIIIPFYMDDYIQNKKIKLCFFRANVSLNEEIERGYEYICAQLIDIQSIDNMTVFQSIEKIKNDRLKLFDLMDKELCCGKSCYFESNFYNYIANELLK